MMGTCQRRHAFVRFFRSAFLRVSSLAAACFFSALSSPAQTTPRRPAPAQHNLAPACSQSSASTPHVPFEDAPRKRAEWFLSGRQESGEPTSRRARSLVLVSSPAENLTRAYLQLQRMRAARTTGRFIPVDWAELGPRPQVDSFWGDVGGRVTALAVDTANDKTGNTLYVGTAFGGVWKVAGASEVSPTITPLGDSSLGLAVGSIALDTRTNPPTIYVGTGEPNNSGDSYYGVGILKLEKGNLPWTKPVAIADNGAHSFLGASVSKILLAADDPKHLYAAVTDAIGSVGRKPTFGIYESPDSGDSWSLTLSAGPATDLIYDDVNKAYFAAIRGVGIYEKKSGTAWTLVSSPFQCKISISDANFSRISLATRGGTLWALVSDSNGFPAQPFPADSGLVQSVDEGKSWIPVQLPDGIYGTGMPQGDYDQDQHAIVSMDSRRWYVGNDGGLWATANSGGSWSNLNAGLGAIQFTSVSPDMGDIDAYFGGSQDNGTAFLVPGGLKWETTWSGDGGYTLQNSRNTLQTFTENYDVSLQRSDYPNGGWYTVVDSRTINERDAFYVPYSLLNDDTGDIILGTYRVWRGPAIPECPGAGWKPVSDELTSGSIRDLVAAPSSNDVVYVVTSDSLVYKTENATDAAPSWANITTNDLPTARVFTSVAINPENPKIVYLGVAGFNTGHIFKTENGGDTWTNISANLIDVPVNAILIDPTAPNDVYLGTDLGVFFAGDGGTPQTDWEQYADGLPLSAVMQLKINTVGTRTLVAATHGRGAWTIPLRHHFPDFSLIASPRVQSDKQGKPIPPVSVKVVAVDNYSGRISLSCNAGHFPCTVSPTKVGAGEVATVKVNAVFQDTSIQINISGKDGTRSHYQAAVAVPSEN